MEIRKLLCENCKAKVRTAEAIYQKQRRLRIKAVGSQEKGKVKINKK
jgi:hypothetical protein